jgi:hypothetical protein
MESMSEVDLGIDPGLSRGIEEIGSERKRVAVLLGDLVQSAIVHA